MTGNFSGSPWLSIADYVLQDLLSSYVNVKNEIDSQKAEGKPNLTANVGKIKRNLTAKVGKILFHGLVVISCIVVSYYFVSLI